MWEALLMLRLIASAMPIGSANTTVRPARAAMACGTFTTTRLAFAAYRLSLPAVSGRETSHIPDTGQTDDQKNIA